MSDGSRSPENTRGINTGISKKGLVTKGIPAVVAGALLAEAVAGCAPPQVVGGSSVDRSKNASDKVLPIPTPTSRLTEDTTVYPYTPPHSKATATTEASAKSTIDSETRQITNANLLQLQNYLSLKEEDVKKYMETGSNEGIESFQVFGGLIVVTGGPNGYNDQESINAIKEAFDSLSEMGIMSELSKLGLKAIARDIPGYGPEGFFGHKPQDEFSFSFDPTNGAKSDVLLDNPRITKNRIEYMSALIEESYGMALWSYLIPGKSGFILDQRYTFKGQERIQKIEFFQEWFKQKEFELSFLPETYQFLKAIIETEGYEKLFQDIRITKALLAAGIFEQKFKEGKISQEDYKNLKESFFYNFRQDLIDLAQSSQALAQKTRH